MAKSTFCFALMAAAAHAGPRHVPISSIPLAVPKRAKIVQPAKTKVYVNATTKPVIPATPKKSKPTPPSGQWKFTPRVEDRGREETNYGFLLKRSF
ncbi:MAG: hypothetical protein ABIS50_04850 [Luteolibacter sp.]|uniref:hypothetical protein n=1 Tax=Luteolibacter sp. TaxID=1962973 RepID=UPI003264F86E